MAVWRLQGTDMIWVGLAVISVLSIIGIWKLLAYTAYALAFLLGLLATLVFLIDTRFKSKFRSLLPSPRFGIPKINEAAAAKQVHPKIDRRISGSSIIDEKLQEVIDLMFRDYISSWYNELSGDPDFMTDMRATLQYSIIVISNRCKNINWVSLITQTLIEELVLHLRQFRLAQIKAETEMSARNKSLPSSIRYKHRVAGEEIALVEEHFFKLDNRYRFALSSHENEIDFARDIAEVMLYLILPEQDFNSKPLRFLLREVVALSSIIPSVHMMSDPDYINQTIAVFIGDNVFNFQTVLDVVRTCNEVVDLQLIISNLERDIDSKLSGNGGDVHANAERFKKHIEGLLFAKRECEMKIKEISGETAVAGPLTRSDTGTRLPLPYILANNTALTYFMEFLAEIHSSALVDMYLTLDGYRTSASMAMQSLASEASDEARRFGMMEMVGPVVSHIYDEYFKEGGFYHKAGISKTIAQSIQERIAQQLYVPDLFIEAQCVVYDQISTKHHEAFLGSDQYQRCMYAIDYDPMEVDDAVAKLDELMTARKRTTSDASTRSWHFPGTPPGPTLSSSPSSSSTSPSKPRSFTISDGLRQSSFNTAELVDQTPLPGCWTCLLLSAELCKEDTKTFAEYKIKVAYTSPDTFETDEWICSRRYSEFHDLHEQVKDRLVSSLARRLVFPGKTLSLLSNNLDKEFLEKRLQALQQWVNALLGDPDIMGQPDVSALASKFLNRGEYMTRKKMKSKPLDKSDDDVKASFAFNDLSEGDKDDDIPLRIMLQLVDEIFELQNKQWIRKQMMRILRQIIQTAFGGSINKKIVEQVDFLISAEQVAKYVENFRNSMWPEGKLCTEYLPREEEEKVMTKMEAKLKLFGILPDEIKRLVGNDAAKKGILSIFEMFQYPRINLRLQYALFEAFLAKLFPENKLQDIFVRLHQQKA